MNKHLLTFFPLGNADTTLIRLSGGESILWDFANKNDPNDPSDKRCSLPEELNSRVTGNYDVVCFTHADEDHIKGFSDYFFLEHATKYQGAERKKIKQLWVPAAVLMDNEAKDEAKILKQEARHRLKNGKGILIFSRPDKMKDWCNKQDDIKYDEVSHLFIDAGKIVPGFSTTEQGIEFFVHSPFASETKKIDRNGECIIVQASFNDTCMTKMILGADGTAELWQDIVNVTKYKGNEHSLEWDLFHISHHCSYLSLNTNGNKGENITNPVEEIKWLYEEKGNRRCRLISSSKPIPVKGSDEDKDDQPPHRQAASYYKNVAETKNGELLVTMQNPKKDNPKPIEFEIDSISCLKLVLKTAATATFAYSSPTPRAGKNE